MSLFFFGRVKRYIFLTSGHDLWMNGTKSVSHKYFTAVFDGSSGKAAGLEQPK